MLLVFLCYKSYNIFIHKYSVCTWLLEELLVNNYDIILNMILDYYFDGLNLGGRRYTYYSRCVPIYEKYFKILLNSRHEHNNCNAVFTEYNFYVQRYKQSQ